MKGADELFRQWQPLPIQSCKAEKLAIRPCSAQRISGRDSTCSLEPSQSKSMTSCSISRSNRLNVSCHIQGQQGRWRPRRLQREAHSRRADCCDRERAQGSSRIAHDSNDTHYDGRHVIQALPRTRTQGCRELRWAGQEGLL